MPIPSGDHRQNSAHREEWDAITNVRKDAIEQEKKTQQEKEVIQQQQESVQREAVLEEVAEAAKRAEGREDWRQEQHAKRLEEQERLRREQLERQQQAALQAKRDEHKAAEQAALADLHRKAIEKRVREKIENAKVEEERQVKNIDHGRERDVKHVDEETERALEHIDRETRKKKELLQSKSAHDRVKAEEDFKAAKKEAVSAGLIALKAAKTDEAKRAARMEESHAVKRAEAERARVTLGQDDRLAQELFDIDTEAKRLKAEVLHNADVRRTRVERAAGNRAKEAQARRESVEKWFEKGRRKNEEVNGF